MKTAYIISINGGSKIAQCSTLEGALEFVAQIHGSFENWKKLVEAGENLIITVADQEH